MQHVWCVLYSLMMVAIKHLLYWTFKLKLLRHFRWGDR